MIVNLWNPQQDIELLDPYTIVYTMTLLNEFPRLAEIVCDYAWTTREERTTHFWIQTDKEVRLEEMTLGEYVTRHTTMIKGMNPFWDLNRAELLTRWHQRFPST